MGTLDNGAFAFPFQLLNSNIFSSSAARGNRIAPPCQVTHLELLFATLSIGRTGWKSSLPGAMLQIRDMGRVAGSVEVQSRARLPEMHAMHSRPVAHALAPSKNWQRRWNSRRWPCPQQRSQQPVTAAAAVDDSQSPLDELDDILQVRYPASHWAFKYIMSMTV